MRRVNFSGWISFATTLFPGRWRRYCSGRRSAEKANKIYYLTDMKRTTLLLAACLTQAISFAQQKPNIVIILSDDHAYQAVSAYGGKLAQTPNIDRIARQGVLFK